MWRTDVTVSIKRFGRSAAKNKSFISTVILFSTHIQAKHWRLGNISYHNFFKQNTLKNHFSRDTEIQIKIMHIKTSNQIFKSLLQTKQNTIRIFSSEQHSDETDGGA